MVRHGLVIEHARRHGYVDLRAPLCQEPRRQAGIDLVDARALLGVLSVVRGELGVHLDHVAKPLLPEKLMFRVDVA
eukprot:5860669-Pyramimonas_sp.AAC.1